MEGVRHAGDDWVWGRQIQGVSREECGVEGLHSSQALLTLLRFLLASSEWSMVEDGS
jgi:hypothetical protein